MVPPEYSRGVQQPQRRRPLVVLAFLLVLSLAAFSAGVFVGKMSNNPSDGDADVATTVIKQPVPVTVTTPAAVRPHAVATGARQLVENNNYVAAAGGNAQSAPAAPVAAVNNSTAGTPAPEQPAATGGALPEPTARAEAAQVTVKTVVSSSKQASVPTETAVPLGSGVNSPAAAIPPPVTAVAAKVVETKGQLHSADVAAAKPGAIAKPAAGGYVVQVGSFRSRADAARMQKRLPGSLSSMVKKADLGKKGVWYRVLVGPLPSKDVADAIKQTLQKRNKIGGFVKKYRP